ncbi:hypothetical protein [Benzoatithermus flavus]|uniref:Uncharacterized protein n=1 Tax=Benzoatithermus flavus TaxID=3108223 RepID=A0ABU8XVC9_9PROT
MRTGLQLTWNQLLDEALETFKAMARTRLRAGELLTLDAWYDIAAKAAEQTAPRRDVAIAAVLQSQPSLMSRPLIEERGSLGETAFVLIREALRDEIAGRMNSLQAQVTRGQATAPAEDRVRALKEDPQAQASWELFAVRLDEAFLWRLARDAGTELLPDPEADPEAAATYIEAFLKEVMPEDLQVIVTLLASSPTLAVRPPAEAQTFEGCASFTLEEAIGERLADLFRQFWEQQNPPA